MRAERRLARGAVLVAIVTSVVVGGASVANAAVIEGQQGATSTSATKHVTVVERTDLPDAPAATCGVAAMAPTMVSESSTSDVEVAFITTVGPATVWVGEDQQDEYHVVSGEIDTTTLYTTTTTLHQTWQGTAAGAPCPTEGQQGFTATTATKHVTVIDRTDLPDLPAAACDATAVAPTLVSQTSTSVNVTSAIVTVGPATIYIGPEQSVEYHVVSGEVDTMTLVTTTTTLHQTWQGTAAGAPCPTGGQQSVTTTPVGGFGAPGPDVIQQIGRLAADTCDAVDRPDLNWSGVPGGGWTPSWSRWINDGAGGPVCTRTLHYHNGWTVLP